MKKWRIEYSADYRPSPLSFWVHHHLDHAVWRHATRFEPPLPNAIPGKGFPFLIVSVSGVELEFASVCEIEHFLDVIQRKNMPTTLMLTRQRRSTYGPNGHWLSRLPAKLMPWTRRKKIIPIIEDGLKQFKALYNL